MRATLGLSAAPRTGWGYDRETAVDRGGDVGEHRPVVYGAGRACPCGKARGARRRQ